MYGDVEVSVFEVDTHHPIPVMQRVGHHSGSSHLEFLFADKLVEGFQVEHRTPIDIFLRTKNIRLKNLGESDARSNSLIALLSSKDIIS